MPYTRTMAQESLKTSKVSCVPQVRVSSIFKDLKTSITYLNFPLVLEMFSLNSFFLASIIIFVIIIIILFSTIVFRFLKFIIIIIIIITF